MDAKLHTATLRKVLLGHGRRRSRAVSLRLLKDHSPRFKDEGKFLWGSDELPISGPQVMINFRISRSEFYVLANLKSFENIHEKCSLNCFHK